MVTARACSTTTCVGPGSCGWDWRSFRKSSAVFEARRAPGRGARARHAQHPQHAQRAFLAPFAAAVIARYEYRLVEPHGAVEAPRRFVAGAKFQVDAGDAGAARRLAHPPGPAPDRPAPLEHALAYCGAAVRRPDREQHEMRTLVAELYDGEAIDGGARRSAGVRVARHHRERLAITDGAHHARRVVLPAQSGFDEVARHHGNRLRVARLGEPDGDGPWGHEHIVP